MAEWSRKKPKLFAFSTIRRQFQVLVFGRGSNPAFVKTLFLEAMIIVIIMMMMMMMMMMMTLNEPGYL